MAIILCPSTLDIGNSIWYELFYFQAPIPAHTMSLGNPPILKPSWPGSPNHQLITPTRWSSLRKYLHVGWLKYTPRGHKAIHSWCSTTLEWNVDLRPGIHKESDDSKALMLLCGSWFNLTFWWMCSVTWLCVMDSINLNLISVSNTHVHMSSVAGSVLTNRGTLTASGPPWPDVTCPAL